MKKLLPLLSALILLLTFSSCKKSAEEMIVGTWNTTGIDISKIDEIAKFLYDLQVANLEDQLEMSLSQIEDLEESEKVSYQQIISDIEQQISDLTTDVVKSNIEKGRTYNSIIFNEDHSLQINSESENKAGTWQIKEEGTKLNIKIENDIITFDIKEISTKELIIAKPSKIETIDFIETHSFSK